MAHDKAALLAILKAVGQEHLLDFWDRLSPTEQDGLAEQIGAIDFAQVGTLYANRGAPQHEPGNAESPPGVRLTAAGKWSRTNAAAAGQELLAAGRVGVILVAGGQGTRLGFDHPKGMYPIGPVSKRSLFQIHFEKITALARRHGVRIPLYLMTSPATHGETIEFLNQRERFGLPADDLHVFCQGTMPAVDAATGKTLLEAPGRIFTGPDGHGGMLAALERSGALSAMENRGLTQIFYFQVDNPLVDIANAEFLGYHRLSGSEMTTQVIAKRDPLEKVGNVVQVDGRLRIIEYIDLPDALAQRRTAAGDLEIWAGSIGVHAFDTAFLRRMAGSPSALPFHYALKKVNAIDAQGCLQKPAAPNAVKFERFIFDLLPNARNAIVVEVDPAEAFAPLKNAPGAATDSPEWVQAQLSAQYGRWLRAAGADVAPDAVVEISPLFALDAVELARKLPEGTRVVGKVRL